MRMFTSTKLLLILALIAANLNPARKASAQSCQDPNCCKQCGAISMVYQYTRSCSEATCWVTLCTFNSNQCTYGTSDRYNDICSTTTTFYCYPD